jgi:hypothetical protein
MPPPTTTPGGTCGKCFGGRWRGEISGRFSRWVYQRSLLEIYANAYSRTANEGGEAETGNAPQIAT